MPYARPTLTALKNQVLQDINSARITDQNGNVVDGLLPKSVLTVLAYAEAGLAYSQYAYLDWISKQAVPYTATDLHLDGWGALKGVIRNPAMPATGTVTFTGISGTDIPLGTSVTRSDGFGYVGTADTSVGSGGTATVRVQATTNGSLGNCSAGTVMLLGNPVAGVQSQGSAAGVFTGGSDQETDDSFRTRVLQRYAAPPQGGDRNDYIEWALAVPGVTRAWVSPNGLGVGTVLVYIMLDNAEAVFGGFPQGGNGGAANETRIAAATGDQLAVANVLFSQQPVTALVYVNAPIAQPVNFTMTDLGANNTPAMQAAIQAALTDMFFRLGNVGGTVNPSTGAAWPAIEPTAWYAALSAVPGLTGFNVTSPSGAIIPSSGSLFTLGATTFVS